LGFEILDVSSHWSVIGRIYKVVAKDVESQFVVTARFDKIPSQVRILEGLQFELKRAKDRDAFLRMKGKVLS
jgi:hypothetical protein